MKAVRPFVVNDAALLSSNVPETDYTSWAIGTPYAAGARVRRVATDYHRVFESAADGNIGHDPALDIAKEFWLPVGPTNRWAMLDQSVGSVTTNANSIEISVQVEGRIDTVALINLQAFSLHVTQTDAVDGVVYDETISLIDTSGIIDGYTYAFEPVVYVRDKALTDLRPYVDSVVDIAILAPASTAEVGACILGLAANLGGTQWEPDLGIQDYSVKGTTDFGDPIIVERAYAKRAAFRSWMDTQAVSYNQRLLADFRAQPICWIGDEDVGATIILGFYKEFSLTVAAAKKSLHTLDIEGVV